MDDGRGDPSAHPTAPRACSQYECGGHEPGTRTAAAGASKGMKEHELGPRGEHHNRRTTEQTETKQAPPAWDPQRPSASKQPSCGWAWAGRVISLNADRPGPLLRFGTSARLGCQVRG